MKPQKSDDTKTNMPAPPKRPTIDDILDYCMKNPLPPDHPAYDPIDLSTMPSEQWTDETYIVIPPDSPELDPTDPDSIEEMCLYLESHYNITLPWVVLSDYGGGIPTAIEEDSYNPHIRSTGFRLALLPPREAALHAAHRNRALALYRQWQAEDRADRPGHTLTDAYHQTGKSR